MHVFVCSPGYLEQHIGRLVRWRNILFWIENTWLFARKRDLVATTCPKRCFILPDYRPLHLQELRWAHKSNISKKNSVFIRKIHAISPHVALVILYDFVSKVHLFLFFRWSSFQIYYLWLRQTPLNWGEQSSRCIGSLQRPNLFEESNRLQFLFK